MIRMSDTRPNEPGTPALVGSHWVLPSLSDVSATRVRMHVSIAVAREEQLTGSDISVQLTADSRELIQRSGPDPKTPLPVFSSRGSTAFALYTFDNLGDLTPSSVTVTLQGKSAEFPLKTPDAAS